MSEFAEEIEVVEGEAVEPSEMPFEIRVDRLMGMIQEDSSVRDRMLCEMYIAFTDFERFTRTMAQNGGPMAMLKAMMGRG
jgi:hypothetical protein